MGPECFVPLKLTIPTAPAPSLGLALAPSSSPPLIDPGSSWSASVGSVKASIFVAPALPALPATTSLALVFSLLVFPKSDVLYV